MFLNEQQERHIDLKGAPVNAPALLATIHRPEIQSGLLTIAFNTAVAAQVSMENAVIALAASAGGVLFADVLVRRQAKNFNRQAFGSGHEGLCIDKKPDGKTPPTSPNNMMGAERLSLTLRSHFMTQACILGLISPYILNTVSDFVRSGTSPSMPFLCLTAGLAVTQITNSVSSILRWERVRDMKWNIVDMPKPLESKQKQESWSGTPQLG